jgi:His-Xaa-Ser system protein HxsD
VNTVIASDRWSCELELDQEVYSLEVCKKACYALMHYASCQIKKTDSSIRILARPGDDCSVTSQEFEALLLDELLDYSLRDSISAQTEDIRNVILSNAFSNTKLVS